MNARTADGAVELPRLDSGVTAVRPPAKRQGAVHQLALSERVRRDGSAYWVDAGNAASSYTLYDIASAPRHVDTMQVARAFTAYQHYSLVRSLPEVTALNTELVVAPNVDLLYDGCDLPLEERAEMLKSAMTILDGVAKSADAAVICSTRVNGRVGDIVCDAADRVVDVEVIGQAVRGGRGVSVVGHGFRTPS